MIVNRCFLPLLWAVAMCGCAFMADDLTEQVQRRLEPRLRQHGITELSKNSYAIQVGDTVRFTGTGKTKSGIMRVEARYTVAEFNNTITWKLNRLEIGDTIYVDNP